MFFFTVLWITVKRIVHNWRVSIGLLTGLILAAGIMSAIPMYSAGSLQRSFVQSWVELDNGRPPFAIIAAQSNDAYGYTIEYRHLERTRASMVDGTRAAAGFDPLLVAEFVNLGSNTVLPADAPERSLLAPRGELASLSNLRTIAEIVDGRWFAERDDGVIEVVVDELTLNRNELSVGDQFAYWYPESPTVDGFRRRDGFALIECVVVGVFRAKAGTTMADWIYPPPFFDRMFADHAVMLESLVRDHGLVVRNFDVLSVFDFQRLYVNDLPGTIARFEALEARWQDITPSVRLWHHPLRFFRDFEERRADIAVFLTILSVPTVGMVLYYIALMAGIAVDHRRKEVAVLRSRGSGKTQILLSFFLEWVVMALVAVAVGPFVGSFVARLIGASSGFLEFVGRQGIPARIDLPAYGYSALAGGLAVLAGMVPVAGSLRHSVVTFVQSRDRRPHVSLWHRFFLDIILIALAVFGYSRLNWESAAVLADGQVPADPLLFFVPVLFIIGGGLVVLRLFAPLMNLIRLAVARLPGVVLQLAFRRLSRSGGEYIPVMLLLIVTVSLGIYSAVTARTLRLNLEDVVRYAVGADIATSEEWFPPNEQGSVLSTMVTSEPPFFQREELPGVVAAARVLGGRAELRRAENFAVGTRVSLMAFEPYEFGRTAWFRRDLTQAHPYQYLDMLARHREGVIVDTRFFEEQELELGMPVTVVLYDQEIPAYIAAHVAYWPPLDPFRSPFILMNLLHVQDYTALQPYNVWYRVEPGDSADAEKVQALIENLVGLGVYVTDFVSAEAELIEMRREPYRMGFFGILSMGFIAALVVSGLGFFVFSVFSIRGRFVQFGALRAMGFSSGQLFGVLGIELLGSIGVPLAIGYGVGAGVSRVFLPFISDRAADLVTVPPFIVVARAADIHSIMLVMGAVFLTALVLLTIIVARLRLTRAIKLGEEA